MVELVEDTIMEEREELMVSPKGGDSTLRIAHFLKPSVSSVGGSVFGLPLGSLSFQETSNSQPKKWQPKVAFKGWRYPPKGWKPWVDSMHSLHQTAWKKAGIHDAVMSSTSIIMRKDHLILGFAERWCSETNTFVFPWGEATITLEDMMILGGYSVLGDSVLTPLEDGELQEIKEKLLEARIQVTRGKANKPCQYQWMAKFMHSGSQIEHEAFLAMWLSRSVFPASPVDTILKNVFPIAVRLARGTKVALAPAVLASIYRDLRLLKEIIVTSNQLRPTDCEGLVLSLAVWAPLQLVQVWVWERFPTLRPKSRSTEYSLPRLAVWHKLRMARIDNVGLAIASAADHFHWRPYARVFNTTSTHKFYREKEEWVLVDTGSDEELEAFARCMRVCELVGFRLECTEKYLPNRVAMQFGMDQDLPGHIARANATHEIAWENYTRPIGDTKLYIPSRLFESDVTTRYLEWWNQSMLAGKDEVKPIVKNRSSSKFLKVAMPQRLNENEADNDALVPPGFPPKCNRVEVNGTVNEDEQTRAEILRNMNGGNGAPLMDRQLQSPSSSTARNESVQKKQSMVKPVENFARTEPVIEIHEKVNNVLSMNSNSGESSTNHTPKIPGVELEARISKLEKMVAWLKAANLGQRFG